MTQYVDEIDQRILHALMSDARNTSAPMIAEDLDVSAGTVRNRIDRLEEENVIEDYTACVNFERISRLTSVFLCTVPANRREELTLAAQSIPGVIHTRTLMAGRRDLHVVAVGETTEDLREIARLLAELDIQIEDEELLQTEGKSPYEPFSPDTSTNSRINEVVTLAERTLVVDVAVAESVPVVGTSLDAAHRQGILPKEAVVVSIERDGDIIRPTGETTIECGDVVTVVLRDGSKEDIVGTFTPEARVE